MPLGKHPFDEERILYKNKNKNNKNKMMIMTILMIMIMIVMVRSALLACFVMLYLHDMCCFSCTTGDASLERYAIPYLHNA